MHRAPHILIVDDDAEIRQLLGDYLRKNGLHASAVGDGAAMRALLAREPVDLIVLDLMLPGEDGLSLCRTLRAQSTVPVIMLTAKGDETDRIVGLEIGADDYLPKPFNPRELLARIKTVLRRTGTADATRGEPKRLCFAGWVLDVTARHLLDPKGVIVPLSGSEYRLLRIFLAHPQRVLSRDQLLDLTQGREAGPFDRSIDVQVSRLRQRLRDAAREQVIIKTVRNEGYVLASTVEAEH
jgi:two-component system OmpR family response regulator